MGGWRPLSPESDKSHDSNASTREPSPRRSTVLESFCRVFPPVETNMEVGRRKNEEEKPLLREMTTKNQGSGSTYGEEEESEVLHNRVYSPEVECHRQSKSWDKDRGMVQVPERMNSCLQQAEEGEPERYVERWREGSEEPEVWSMEDRRLVDFYRITIRENGLVIPSLRELMKQREEMIERRKKKKKKKCDRQ